MGYTWFTTTKKAVHLEIAQPRKIVKNQIDFIVVNTRPRNCCIAVKTYPGADVQSDHVGKKFKGVTQSTANSKNHH